MRTIYLIGFRGTGFRDTQFANEPALIRAGHVGWAFEEETEVIYGFHPTAAAVERVGGEAEAIKWLKAKHTLDGTVQYDTAVFERAHELAQQGARTAVWQISVMVDDVEFARVHTVTINWYNEHSQYSYGFPPDEPKPDQDNCATFPRRLGLPVLDAIGQISEYVRKLEADGDRWQPT